MATVQQMLAHLRSGMRIPVKTWMETALYAPDGYYNQMVTIGGDGADFYTAAASPLFARTLADYVVSVWQSMDEPDCFQVVELGAGQGDLARELLNTLSTLLPDIWLEYVVVEKSVRLTEIQQAKLTEWMNPDGERRASCRFGNPNPNLDSIIIGNEVLDAFAVERMRRTADGWQRGHVEMAMNEPRLIHELWLPAPTWLARLANTYLPIGIGEEAELCPAYDEFMVTCRAYGQRVHLLFIDYGITEDELRTGIRPHGTLRGYSQHQLCSPFENPGQRDITADVNWHGVAIAAENAGFTDVSIRAQGEFLLAHGALDRLTELTSSMVERDWLHVMKQTNEFKQLVLPGGFGERFQICTCRFLR